MALTKIDVCNQALLKVGGDAIASLDTSASSDDGTIQQARLCNIFYDQALEETMRVYPWNCCTARTIPVKLSETPAFGYENAFQLPNDCMRVINVFDDPNQNLTGISWVVEGNQILCDYDVIYLKYVKKPTDVGTLDSLAVRALICNLALKLAIPLQLDDDQAGKILRELEQVVLPSARSIDTFENKELLLEESNWVVSRNIDTPSYQ
jgi:hypothetical protein